MMQSSHQFTSFRMTIPYNINIDDPEFNIREYFKNLKWSTEKLDTSGYEEDPRVVCCNLFNTRDEMKQKIGIGVKDSKGEVEHGRKAQLLAEIDFFEEKHGIIKIHSLSEDRWPKGKIGGFKREFPIPLTVTLQQLAEDQYAVATVFDANPEFNAIKKDIEAQVFGAVKQITVNGMLRTPGLDVNTAWKNRSNSLQTIAKKNDNHVEKYLALAEIKALLDQAPPQTEEAYREFKEELETKLKAAATLSSNLSTHINLFGKRIGFSSDVEKGIAKVLQTHFPAGKREEAEISLSFT